MTAVPFPLGRGHTAEAVFPAPESGILSVRAHGGVSWTLPNRFPSCPLSSRGLQTNSPTDKQQSHAWGQSFPTPVASPGPALPFPYPSHSQLSAATSLLRRNSPNVRKCNTATDILELKHSESCRCALTNVNSFY